MYDYCGNCPHSDEHEVVDMGDGYLCSKWGECGNGEPDDPLVKVRCVTVKKEEKSK